jgi:ATP phosphoribosyltransferase
MSETKLIVGMPAGSLADPTRGGSLVNLLRNAGFPTKGYDQGGPTSFPLHSFIVGWDGRPQEFGAQIALGEVDIAISGDDWMRERTLEMQIEYNREIHLRKVLSLKRGDVRIVIIRTETGAGDCDTWLKGLLKTKPLVTMVSEMPYLALDWFRKKCAQLGFPDSHKDYSIQKFKTPPKIAKGLVIYETWGKTEAKVKQGAVDFGLEITQSGSSIRNYGLEIADVVMQSEAGIWANADLKANPEKYDLARMVLLNLYGSIFAEDKVLVLFNALKTDKRKILDYLEKNKLFGTEPTMNEGDRYMEFSIELKTHDPALPIARVRYELAKIGATAIETVPLESSIPSLAAIDF